MHRTGELFGQFETMDGHFGDRAFGDARDDHATDILLIEGTPSADTILVSQTATGTRGMTYQYFTIQREDCMSVMVSQGKGSLKSAKIFSNLGMMKIKMKLKIDTATVMTTAG